MSDLSTNLPKQEGKYDSNKKYSCFGYSIRGSSHVVTETPCQDYNNFEYIKSLGVLIACIADGVGSCPLSHWGAYVAVETALKFVKERLSEICQGRLVSLCEQHDVIRGLLNEAFQQSLVAVESFAEENLRPVVAFFSTLTFVIYDGEVLCCEHVGDDGVVAQFMDGSIEMVTERIKGEEASSVYPLQSKQNVWKYSEAGLDEKGPVVAFAMATDGVLDKFVFEDEIYKKTDGCCSGIYYPFMEPMVYGDSRVSIDSGDSAQKMHYYLQKMNSENYRKQITDDLTLVSVVNLKLIKKSIKPAFDSKAFKDASNCLREQQRRTLYGSGVNTIARHDEEVELLKPVNFEPVDKNYHRTSGYDSNNKQFVERDAQRNNSDRGYESDGQDIVSFINDYRRREYILRYIKGNKFLLLGIASVILIFGILLGILGSHIVGEIKDNHPAPQETEVIIPTPYIDDSDEKEGTDIDSSTADSPEAQKPGSRSIDENEESPDPSPNDSQSSGSSQKVTRKVPR